jgi:hypothetical protein
VVSARLQPAFWLRFKCDPQRNQNPVQIAHHFFIGEPYDPETLCTLKRRVARKIALAIVRIAINLDDQASRRAEEIDNSPPHQRLTAKLVPKKAAVAQLHPHPAFRFGGIATHGRSAFEQDPPCWHATTPNPLL